MGFFRRAISAGLGMEPVERTTERLLAELDTRGQQGLAECSVTFSQSDVGIRNTVDLVTPMMISRIQDAGHAVLAEHSDASNQNVTLRVKIRGYGGQDAKIADASPQRASTNEPVAEDPSGRQEQTIAALAQYGTQAAYGHPFGAGPAAHQAHAKVSGIITDDAERRYFGKQLGNALVAFMRAGALTLDTMDEAMGITEQAFKRYGLKPEEREICWELKQNATRLLGDFAQGDGDTVKRWVYDTDLVVTMIVYHVVVWHRLTSATHLPPLTRSQLPSPWTSGGGPTTAED